MFIGVNKMSELSVSPPYVRNAGLGKNRSGAKS